MTDENNTPEPTEQTLDDVYNEFNVEPQPTPAPSVNEQSSPQIMPDPITDLEGFSKYQVERNSKLEQQINDLSNQFQQTNNQALKAQEEQDLQKIITDLSPKMEGVNPKMIKYALADKYNSDPKFASLWDGRTQNPSALNKALAAITPDLQKEFSIKVDSQVEADQRALDQATNSMTSSTDEVSESAKALGLGGNEFDAYMQKVMSGK